MFKKKNIYLDYAASTPIDPRVISVMTKAQGLYANPSAIHALGVKTKQVLEESRLKMARLAQVKKEEVFFTASGTESNNLILQGIVKAYNGIGKPHIITSVIEHPAVLEVCRMLEETSVAEVTYVKVNKEGLIDPLEIKSSLKENTVLVSVMQANNEIGTIQPIAKISRLIKEYRKNNNTEYPYIHTDASQCPCYLDFHLGKLGVDLLTLDGVKVYGPKGIGLVIKKSSVKIDPIILGGGQELGFRSGTENVPGIVGLSKALSIADSEREEESERIGVLRDYCIGEILRVFPKSSLNGSCDMRLPNNINICFPGVDTEFLVLKLDNVGIATSFSSSCRNVSENSTSYVVKELQKDECAGSSLRITLGRFTKKKDIKFLLKSLKDLI